MGFWIRVLVDGTQRRFRCCEQALLLVAERVCMRAGLPISREDFKGDAVVIVLVSTFLCC